MRTRVGLVSGLLPQDSIVPPGLVQGPGVPSTALRPPAAGFASYRAKYNRRSAAGLWRNSEGGTSAAKAVLVLAGFYVAAEAATHKSNSTSQTQTLKPRASILLGGDAEW